MKIIIYNIFNNIVLIVQFSMSFTIHLESGEELIVPNDPNFPVEQYIKQLAEELGVKPYQILLYYENDRCVFTSKAVLSDIPDDLVCKITQTFPVSIYYHAGLRKFSISNLDDTSDDNYCVILKPN